MTMCEECGDNIQAASTDLESFMSQLMEMMEPAADMMEEYLTEPDITITGPDDMWQVEVAKVGGTSDLDKGYEPGQQWIVNIYRFGLRSDSILVDANKIKTTQQVADEFAAHIFGYEY